MARCRGGRNDVEQPRSTARMFEGAWLLRCASQPTAPSRRNACSTKGGGVAGGGVNGVAALIQQADAGIDGGLAACGNGSARAGRTPVTIVGICHASAVVFGGR